MADGIEDFFVFKAILTAFFQEADKIAADAFLGKEETVFKNLSFDILDLVLLNQVSQFIGYQTGI